MENVNISDLAQLLRDFGDRILNSECKFSLSEGLLKNLNDSFAILNDQKESMNSSFHVINSSSSNIKSDFFRDINFLHDFVQKTSSLKLIADDSDVLEDDSIDISHFKNIRLLELYKIDVNKIKGIQSLRARIQYLVCRWSLNSLSEILEKCGSDKSQGFLWNELKAASFSHNSISELDISLEFAPWLHSLDLSYNLLKDSQPLNALSNLKYLNLSYNQLDAVPNFSGQICSRLQVLILNNNFIENLNDVIHLVNLRELNLRQNCFIDHQSLLPLTLLAALQSLSLEGNPLSFHPHYRNRLISYLHSNTATVRFLLDDKVLTKTESRNCGKIQPVFYHNRQHMQSISSSISEATIVANERPKRVRAAMILDGEEASEMDDSMTSVASLLTTNDHLETKKTIEQLRRQYGEKWLHCQSASIVQDVLGLEKSLPLSSASLDALVTGLEARDFDRVSREGTESINEGESYVTASDSTNNDEGPYSTAEQNLINPSCATDEDDDDDDVLGEGEESLYLVTPKDNPEPIFLVVTNTHIWERDCSSGKEKTRWSIDSLLSCCTSGVDPVSVSLEFDTVKRDKKMRDYELDKEDAEKLSKLLKDLLSVSETHNSRMALFKCIKCGTKFGVEKRDQKAKKVCPTPTCGSTLVIEDDEE